MIVFHSRFKKGFIWFHPLWSKLNLLHTCNFITTLIVVCSQNNPRIALLFFTGHSRSLLHISSFNFTNWCSPLLCPVDNMRAGFFVVRSRGISVSVSGKALQTRLRSLFPKSMVCQSPLLRFNISYSALSRKMEKSIPWTYSWYQALCAS